LGGLYAHRPSSIDASPAVDFTTESHHGFPSGEELSETA